MNAIALPAEPALTPPQSIRPAHDSASPDGWNYLAVERSTVKRLLMDKDT